MAKLTLNMKLLGHLVDKLVVFLLDYGIREFLQIYVAYRSYLFRLLNRDKRALVRYLQRHYKAEC